MLGVKVRLLMLWLVPSQAASIMGVLLFYFMGIGVVYWELMVAWWWLRASRAGRVATLTG